MMDRRRSTRRRTLLEGRVEVAKLNGWAMDCAVRNVSDDGACIIIASDAVVPQNFELSISGAASRPARLVWFRGGQAGVALVPSHAT